MFKITPLADLAAKDGICRLFKVEPKDGYFIYLMQDYDTGAPMGISQFEITAEGGYISDLTEIEGLSDFEAMFILGRQTMNFIDKCGAHTCFANPEGADLSLLRAVGFREREDGRLFVNMEGMFDGKCDGHPVKLEESGK